MDYLIIIIRMIFIKDFSLLFIKVNTFSTSLNFFNFYFCERNKSYDCSFFWLLVTTITFFDNWNFFWKVFTGVCKYLKTFSTFLCAIINFKFSWKSNKNYKFYVQAVIVYNNWIFITGVSTVFFKNFKNCSFTVYKILYFL